jgi:hypothetical protein
MKTLSTTQSGLRRLPPRQTADVLGITVNQVMLFSAKGGRFFDPSFPPRVGGTFSEEAVNAFKQAQEHGAKQGTSPTAPPSVATTDQSDRRATSDRRMPRV